MTLEEQIYAQALILTGDMTPQQDALLRVLCRVARNAVAGRLRPGIKPEDIPSEFVSACSLTALAALSEGDRMPEHITAGELTIHHGDLNAAAKCLRGQAELILIPYVRDSFAFLGV